MFSAQGMCMLAPASISMHRLQKIEKPFASRPSASDPTRLAPATIAMHRHNKIEKPCASHPSASTPINTIFLSCPTISMISFPSPRTSLPIRRSSAPGVGQGLSLPSPKNSLRIRKSSAPCDGQGVVLRAFDGGCVLPCAGSSRFGGSSRLLVTCSF